MPEEQEIDLKKVILTNQEAIQFNQKALGSLLSNQHTIIENQDLIKANQQKLDKLLANQEVIQANQEIIQANQTRILTNQDEILALLRK
ncbi:MAG: hypothetical protein ACREEM_08295 [Blastocatellia bacterium]